MKMQTALLLASLVALRTVSAQTCERPHPFDHTSAIRGNASFVEGAGAACDLVASVDAANSTPSGAFAWYSLPYAPPIWRISFRIDVTGFGDTDSVSSLDILSASARRAWPAGLGPSTLLRVRVFKLASLGPDPAIAAIVACNDASCVPSGYVAASTLATSFSSGDLFRFELHMGAGGDGELLWWRNADFADPPSGVIGPLDNAAWNGVQHAALGAFQPSGSASVDGGSIRLYAIDSPYDELFWSDFDD
jgi:hypothetical protein